MRDDSVVAPTKISQTDVLSASPPIFRWNVADRLTRVHPVVPPLIFIPAIAVLGSVGSGDLRWRSYVLALAGGYGFWTLCEYWGHRTVFHFEPDHGFGARLHWMIHGVHHDHPNDPMRLVLPPVLSLPLAAGFWFLFVVTFGREAGSATCAGFFTGYLFYDMLHYSLHHARPKSPLGRWLRELHMRHHFEDDERGFGVSVPYWDMVFGTYTRRRNNRNQVGV